MLWHTEIHLLRNPLQRWNAKRSLTQLASNDTPRNSGWENYQRDGPTKHFVTLAERNTSETIRHNTLLLWLRDLPAIRCDTTLCNSGWENYQRDDPIQHFATLAERTTTETIRHITLQLWLRELPARRSDTALCNSAWENRYQRDDPTEHFAILVDRTRREIFRHDTLELCTL